MAILVPTPVAVKNAGTPAPAARMRSASVPCGTISSSILPARYSVLEHHRIGRARERADDLAHAARVPSAAPARYGRRRRCWQATVRSVAPCSISPSISAFGWPTAPKPPISTVEPSLMPAMASAMDWTILLIMLGASSGSRRRPAGQTCAALSAMQDRAKGEHVERPKNGASGIVGGRGRARKPTHRRPCSFVSRHCARSCRSATATTSIRSQAVFASSLRDLGAIFAVLYLGLAIDRIGPERSLALHYACARAEAAGRSASGGWVASPHRCWAGNCWRSAYRRRIFLSACVFALIAATATALLAFRGSRIPLPGAEEVAASASLRHFDHRIRGERALPFRHGEHRIEVDRGKPRTGRMRRTPTAAPACGPAP